jgi:hypothetical protein
VTSALLVVDGSLAGSDVVSNVRVLSKGSVGLINISKIEVQPPKYVKSELAWKGSGYLITASASLLRSLLYIRHSNGPFDYSVWFHSYLCRSITFHSSRL